MNAQAAARAVDGVRPPRRDCGRRAGPSGATSPSGCCSSRPGWWASSASTCTRRWRRFYYSFTDFRILQDPTWVGLDNYAPPGRRPALLEVARPTPLYLAGPGRAPGDRDGPRHRPPAQRPGHPRDRDLPHDLLPAGRGPARSRRRSCGSGCSTPSTVSSTSCSGLVGIEGPKWFYDPDWAKHGIILMTVWAAGDVVDHLPRRAPGRVQDAVRGGRGRRRGSVRPSSAT